jgi:hypothetical protein
VDGGASLVGRNMLWDPFFWQIPVSAVDDDIEMAEVVPSFPVLRVVDDKWGTEKDVPNERKASTTQQDSWTLVVEFNPRSCCCCCRRCHTPPESLDNTIHWIFKDRTKKGGNKWMQATKSSAGTVESKKLLGISKEYLSVQRTSQWNNSFPWNHTANGTWMRLNGRQSKRIANPINGMAKRTYLIPRLFAVIVSSCVNVGIRSIAFWWKILLKR